MEASTRPHYLLFSDADTDSASDNPRRWRFRLEALDGTAELEAADEEPELERDRLALLAVVRGLEALDQPSRVTLVTSSRYVARGLRFGLEDWRQNCWQWERFGRLTPVKNNDLWQRVDRALRFHQVECRTWRFDAAHVDRPVQRPHHRPAPSAGRREPSSWWSSLQTALSNLKPARWSAQSLDYSHA